jgi:hypothetical protein
MVSHRGEQHEANGENEGHADEKKAPARRASKALLWRERGTGFATSG